jgi:hypothetical protein
VAEYLSRFRWEFRLLSGRGFCAPPQLGSRAYKRVRVGNINLRPVRIVADVSRSEVEKLVDVDLSVLQERGEGV